MFKEFNKDENLVKCIVWQLVKALYAAHQKQVMHCDIKPENFLINDAGEVVLADFGLAKMIS